MSPFTPGLRLHDRFTLVEPLGEGGMSQVWRAVDELLGRPVAVKVLTSPLSADPLLRQATWREARAAARLAHPNVIHIYDYGEAHLSRGARVPYLVMELIEGQSLAARLAGGPLPWPAAVRTGAQVAAGLAAAHRIGVVHRDVKPGNVMLTAGGAKVVDFGVAALAGTRSGDGGWVIGTPTYAAPEQLHPVPPQPASDVYALGVLLYEALTGYPPLRFGTWAEAAAFHQTPAPRASRLPGLSGPPDAVIDLCLACLATRPADRPTAEQVAAVLAAAVGMPDPAAVLHDRTAVLPITPAASAPPVAAGTAAPPFNLGPPPLAPTTIAPRRAAGLPSRHRTPVRRLAVALIGAAVAAGLATAIFVVTSRPVGTQVAAAPTAAAPAPTPTATNAVPSSPQEVITQIERTIAEAATGGAISHDAAQELRDKLDELRDGRGRGKAHKRPEELLKQVNELRDDGEMNQQTADELTALLGSLAVGHKDSRGDEAGAA